ncbi:MAG: FtsK/SpoIIIE domain-containing protein, partial [Chloroflexi bacterium]|nr:FtsK/SpoIIIE domain-containing protein [Chloroflexota bacterium]
MAAGSPRERSTTLARPEQRVKRSNNPERKRQPSPPRQGWHLPPHLVIDSIFIAIFTLLSILFLATLPGLSNSGIILREPHRFLSWLFGDWDIIVVIAVWVLAINIARWQRFSGPVPYWLRFVGLALIVLASTAISNTIVRGSAGSILEDIFAIVNRYFGSASWVIWIACALLGSIWLFHVELPHMVQATHLIAVGAIRTIQSAMNTIYELLRQRRQTASSPSSRHTEPSRQLGNDPQQSLEIVQPALPVIQTSSSHHETANTDSDPPEGCDAPAKPVPTPSVSASGAITWQLPSPLLLRYGRPIETSREAMMERAKLIERTLAEYGVAARVQEIRQGPRVTQFGVRPDPGIKVARILGLQNDLAMALEAKSVRIEAPVPGKPYVGIEVPNPISSPVALRSLMESEEFQRFKQKGTRLPIAIGGDVAGEPVFGDLSRMPHLLVAGATGAGKSVFINALITCLLLQFTPDELQLLLVDPKQVELTSYNVIPHLKVPVVVDVNKVVGALDWCVQEMERRYTILASENFRDVQRLNEHARAHRQPTLPYIIVVIDELADLMMQAPDQVEQQICRLAQKARAIGIHLVLATQRPSVDVITGLIKANFPSRIAFAVSSGVDSRTILDGPGAERLLGSGDMLYTPSDALHPIRVQGAWVSDDEIEDVLSFW